MDLTILKSRIIHYAFCVWKLCPEIPLPLYSLRGNNNDNPNDDAYADLSCNLEPSHPCQAPLIFFKYLDVIIKKPDAAPAIRYYQIIE